MMLHLESFRRGLPALLVAVLTTAPLALLALAAAPARADTAPVAPVTLATVSADSLPTVQVNGVVWSQVVVGNTVYATGSFSSARPAGSAAGSNETPRSNILAYNLSTGALLTTWAPSLNAQGLVVTAAPDGSKIFVGGDFTSVSGVAKNRIVALDPGTGAVLTAFAAGVNSRVRALVATSSGLYAGGLFTTSGGVARSRLAAFSISTGALLTWAPTADREVMAITAPPGTTKIVAGGRFATLNGVANYGMGAVDATTGAGLAWPVNAIVRNAGDDASIYHLTSDSARVYGTAYAFGPGGNLENSFAADAVTGNLSWVVGCRGDTYSSAVLNGVLYNVGHAHDCSSIGGHPQTNPTWTYQRALAFSAVPGAQGQVNTGGNFNGRRAPELLHWLPTLDSGTFTGQGQAAWSVAGNSQYVVLGGEFPRVNYIGQQGLARFAVRALAPNTQGPQTPADLVPTLTAVAPNQMRLNWTASWDRDNRRLSYEVLRGSNAATATVVGTVSADSAWWSKPPLTFTDTGVPAGSVTYRIRAKDALNNPLVSAPTTGTATGAANVPPVAAFTTSSSGLLVAVNGSTSSDADGTITSYAWDFGDGATGTGVSASHTYAAAGTYSVKLTVTDNTSMTATLTKSVTVAPATGGTTLADDPFTRTVASGFGTAVTGGSWALSGSGTSASVDGSAGKVSIAAGRTAALRLSGVNSSSTDVVSTGWLEQAATGGGVYLAVSPRSTATGEYRPRIRVLSTGAVQIGATTVVNGTETALGAMTTVSGLTYTAGTKLRIRAQATGVTPTTLRARVWIEGTAEPAGWQFSTTDSTAGLQTPGSVGVSVYVSSSATNAPVIVGIDDLHAGTP